MIRSIQGLQLKMQSQVVASNNVSATEEKLGFRCIFRRALSILFMKVAGS